MIRREQRPRGAPHLEEVAHFRVSDLRSVGERVHVCACCIERAAICAEQRPLRRHYGEANCAGVGDWQRCGKCKRREQSQLHPGDLQRSITLAPHIIRCTLSGKCFDAHHGVTDATQSSVTASKLVSLHTEAALAQRL